MTVCEHETLEQLIAKRDAIKDDVRNWRRLHAVLLARQGWSAAAIAEQLAVKPRSAQRWIAAYNAELRRWTFGLFGREPTQPTA